MKVGGHLSGVGVFLPPLSCFCCTPGCLTREHLGDSPVCLPPCCKDAGVTDMLHHLESFYVGFPGLNSGHQACMTSTFTCRAIFLAPCLVFWARVLCSRSWLQNHYAYWGVGACLEFQEADPPTPQYYYQ